MTEMVPVSLVEKLLDEVTQEAFKTENRRGQLGRIRNMLVAFGHAVRAYSAGNRAEAPLAPRAKRWWQIFKR
jgi:hypothetical protein